MTYEARPSRDHSLSRTVIGPSGGGRMVTVSSQLVTVGSGVRRANRVINSVINRAKPNSWIVVKCVRDQANRRTRSDEKNLIHFSGMENMRACPSSHLHTRGSAGRGRRRRRLRSHLLAFGLAARPPAAPRDDEEPDGAGEPAEQHLQPRLDGRAAVRRREFTIHP